MFAAAICEAHTETQLILLPHFLKLKRTNSFYTELSMEKDPDQNEEKWVSPVRVRTIFLFENSFCSVLTPPIITICSIGQHLKISEESF